MQNNMIEDISILIAEDEKELRDYLSEYLKIFFKNVYVASCGYEAYKQYEMYHPDIILSDINMPNLDGLSMISKIRKNDEHTNIIIMSAHSEQEKLLRAIELKLVTYLIKPIKTDVLKKVLFELVEKLRKTTKRVYFSNNVYWDKVTNTLWSNGITISLKPKEILLFQLLCSKPNTPFTTKEIFEYINNDKNKEFSEYAVTSFIKRLRAKLPMEIIKNEYGTGYKVMVGI